eukprot:gene5964-6203_t
MIVEALSKEPMDTQVLDSLEIVFLHLAMPKLISYKLHHLVPKLANYLLTRSDLNEHTCSTVFNGYAMSNRVDLALSTWEQLAARGVDIGAFGSSALMKALAKQRDIPKALQRLETEPANLPDSFTYTALMRAILVSGRVELTQQVFENMLEDSVGALQAALAVFRQELRGRGLMPDAYTCTALLTACARFASQLSWEESRRLATSNTYISMMCFLLEQEQSSACKQLYAAMQAEGIQPDAQGWEKLLQAGQESGMAEFLQQLRAAQEYRAMAAQWGTRQPSGAQQAGQAGVVRQSAGRGG